MGFVGYAGTASLLLVESLLACSVDMVLLFEFKGKCRDENREIMRLSRTRPISNTHRLFEKKS